VHVVDLAIYPDNYERIVLKPFTRLPHLFKLLSLVLLEYCELNINPGKLLLFMYFVCLLTHKFKFQPINHFQVMSIILFCNTHISAQSIVIFKRKKNEILLGT